MPKGYVIFTEAIKDQAGMKAYGRAAGESIAQGGATVLAVDSRPQVLEGEWHGEQTVVLEFESVEAAQCLVRLGGVRKGEAAAAGRGRHQCRDPLRLLDAAATSLNEPRSYRYQACATKLRPPSRPCARRAHGRVPHSTVMACSGQLPDGGANRVGELGGYLGRRHLGVAVVGQGEHLGAQRAADRVAAAAGRRRS